MGFEAVLRQMSAPLLLLGDGLGKQGIAETASGH